MRWLRILGGLVLVLISLLFVVGSAALVLRGPSENRVTWIVGVVVCVVSLWLLVRGIRLLFNRPIAGGLMGPLSLRVAAVLFLCVPVGALWTGHYQKWGFLAVLQGVGYVFVSAVLWGMATRVRKARDEGQDR